MNTLKVINPRTGHADYEIPDHDETYVAARVKELRSAQSAWCKTSLAHRCRVLGQWRDAIARHSEAITAALCLDTGRRLMAQIETSGILQRIDYWIRRAPEIMEQTSGGTSAMLPSVSYQHNLLPYPVVGVISPWNLPITLALIDTIPALLAGCSVVLKTSEVTPRFIAPLREATREVPGLNAVLNFVTGAAGTGIALINNADAICFTGSVETGKKVAVSAAQNFIPAFLELGGKDPAIVLPSADLDNAATAILRSAAGLTGQACQSLERIYVHQSVYAEFLNLLTSKAKKIQFNYPDINHGHIGPFIFPDQAAKVGEQLEDAVSHGAEILCGGEVQELGGGWYCLPTVITGVNHDMLIMKEETFGPILPVMAFDNIDQAITMANDSEFGLSAAVFSNDAEEARAVADRIVAGAVSINDASLTAMANDVEKNSFCMSGMGGSRMGDQGLQRFFRKQAVLFQSEPAAPLEFFAESPAD
jgi:succinate-semialdehyde dehydrogenase/glutarate-semialdehyde dehydrogenase